MTLHFSVTQHTENGGSIDNSMGSSIGGSLGGHIGGHISGQISDQIGGSIQLTSRQKEILSLIDKDIQI